MGTKIGTFTPENPFFLAPMAGFTDSAYRTICGRMGAALTYTEMVSAKGLYYGDRKSPELLMIGEEENPVGFQIFGSEPDIMAWAAEKLESHGNVLLDINMGCPVPKVVKNGEGSALLRNPELIYQITKKVSEATDKPVTIKMRTGIEGAPQDAARLCAEAAIKGGVSAIAVHGRTREQYYSGAADLNIIKDIKDLARELKGDDFPVIGNGDIKTFDDAKHMMDYTGCDFVMIGRAAVGDPWIFSRLTAALEGGSGDVEAAVGDHDVEAAAESRHVEAIKAMIIEHYKALEKNKGEYIAVRELRKFISKYLKGVEGSLKVRRLVNSIESGDKLIETILQEL